MTTTPPYHPYIRFRIRLARHALIHFAASLGSSLKILLGLAGPAVVGVVAMLALPCLYAATLAWPAACGVVLAQALLMAAPVWLLRRRLLPADVALWLPALPLARTLRWRADIAVAGLLMAPLALAYAISIALWLHQAPDWLRPAAPQGIAATLLSLLLSWACSSAILARRVHAPAPARCKPGAANNQGNSRSDTPYAVRRWRPRALLLCQRLFWLPFWRRDSAIGLQQSLLWLGAAGAALLWLWRPPGVPAPVFGLAASVLLFLLTDRGDKAVREQIALLRPVIAAWPLAGRRLEWGARLFSLLPALSVLLLFGAGLGYLGNSGGMAGAYSRTVAALYIGLGGAAHGLIIALPGLSDEARTSLICLSVLLLSAIGSELWN